LKLWFHEYTQGFCSWSTVLAEMCLAAKALGHEVHKGNKPPRQAWKWVEVWWGPPGGWGWSEKPTQLKVGFSLSESDQLLKTEAVPAIKHLQEADVLFVPTQSSKRAFLEMPIDIPIKLCPLGVNPTIFGKAHINFDDTPFKFLHLGVTQFRKGSWLVPEAFHIAFPNENDVGVTIASPVESKMFDDLSREYGADKRIDFVLRHHPNPARHYDGHHVLVSPHLSEGWGLCITEAMAIGMPSLVSRCSAPRDYFSQDYGWWIEMGDHYAPVNQCLADTPGFWRLPDVYDLADKMRMAYEHRSECERRGKQASIAAESMTWKHSVTKLLEESALL